MNIEGVRKFMDKNKDQIIDLFLIYQMIEILLFLKLHLPDLLPEERDIESLEEMNKKLNSKTLGNLKNKYLEKFPNDDYEIVSKLIFLKDQRNSFMHSLWITIALFEKEEKVFEMGSLLLNDFKKNANELLDEIHKLPT